MRSFLVFIFASFSIVLSMQAAQVPDRTRNSITDTAYLSCSVWNGHEWTEPTNRSARTPVMESPQGLRAYAEVKAIADGGGCVNTTTLFIVKGETIKTVYIKSGLGNGIHIVGWSPNGDALLAEVNLWRYQPNMVYTHLGVLYYASSQTAIETSELTQTLAQHFGSACEGNIEGWKQDNEIFVKISQLPAQGPGLPRACGENQREFVFNLRSKVLSQRDDSKRP